MEEEEEGGGGGREGDVRGVDLCGDGVRFRSKQALHRSPARFYWGSL